MLLSSILIGLHRWLRYRESVRHLSQFTDRELQDLGITRGEIAFVIWRGR